MARQVRPCGAWPSTSLRGRCTGASATRRRSAGPTSTAPTSRPSWPRRAARRGWRWSGTSAWPSVCGRVRVSLSILTVGLPDMSSVSDVDARRQLRGTYGDGPYESRSGSLSALWQNPHAQCFACCAREAARPHPRMRTPSSTARSQCWMKIRLATRILGPQPPHAVPSPDPIILPPPGLWARHGLARMHKRSDGALALQHRLPPVSGAPPKQGAGSGLEQGTL